MEIKYDVEIPSQNAHRAVYANAIDEFMKSDKQNMCMTFDEYAPTKKAYMALRSLANRRGGFKVAMRGWSVYCVKN